MIIHLLYGYRGQLTNFEYWPAGEYEVSDGDAAYLIENGHAEALPDAAQEAEDKSEVEPEAKPKGKRR